MAHSTKGYSEDLRLRVVKARLGGKSVSEIVTLYEVDDNSVYRWVERYEATGSVAARQRGSGRKPKIQDMAKFEACARAHAHGTLKQMQAAWEDEVQRCAVPSLITGLTPPSTRRSGASCPSKKYR